MPLLTSSTYRPPLFLRSGHLQTILPNYFAHGPNIVYRRQRLDMPDGDHLALDWADVGSDRLVILNHGLCGHSRRHYALHFAQVFNQVGWDCLVWNYRGTSTDPEPHERPVFTTNNSTDELDAVVQHALSEHGYRKIAITGFSMGGNIGLLYLTRQASTLPDAVVGGAFFCATTDLAASSKAMGRPLCRPYERHFLKKLIAMATARHQQFPEVVPLPDARSIQTIPDFDDAITSPVCGFDSAEHYYSLASSAAYLSQLDRPVLLVQPLNDPFLDGLCYPRQFAQSSPHLYLETPSSGGHCGFITFRDTWWPAQRACQFLTPLLNA